MNNRLKRNIKLKYYINFNTSFAKVKFLNIIFLRKYFTLNKKFIKFISLSAKNSIKF